jgi:hypothetical protein
VAPADHSGGGGASAPQPHNVHKHVHSIHGPATLLKRLMTPEGRCAHFAWHSNLLSPLFWFFAVTLRRWICCHRF